ncbi:PDZ domain-containing protein [Acidaminobacter sp. JC074]|uniref:S1C family serine protease n=1 Tax=Acidaminobacter sp. JC074 TaxID=2530199 RepID=UPI001F0D3054|nr:trypsin-like peptidase domain-containing protein [Acidaminobacter sp. JC074]MCH4888240.1 PDZ domain-containing protein [Acidaminobacter sp. JC074]
MDKDYEKTNSNNEEITRGSDINFVLIETEDRDEKILDEKAFQEKLHQEAYLKSKAVYHDEPKKEEKKRSLNRFVAAVLVIAIVGGFTAGVGYRAADHYFFSTPEASIQYIPELVPSVSEVSYDTPNITQIANALEPSVVAITNQIVQESFFGTQTGTSAGSGVIFDISTEKVYILTNHHVIDGSNDISISFFGDNTYTAKLVGSDKDTDLAVLTVDIASMNQMDLDKIRPVTIGNSKEIQVGEPAIAIGNPLGYNNTVTVGIISAVDRAINSDLNALNLIQTDAAINPGNSGGALVNARGELIGINTIKISDTDVEGIGFAIPINSALPILEEIVEKGHVAKPFIGIYGRDVTEELSKMYKTPQGIMIADLVPKSPASRSELKQYDIITEINGVSVLTMEELNTTIRNYSIGDTIQITVQRETEGTFKSKIIELTIGDRYENN